MKVGIPYDSTAYIQDAINEVLQHPDRDAAHRRRGHLPVSRARCGRCSSRSWPSRFRSIGAVFLMLAFGFTINLLTLLAIVLSVGLVVDDAIVMVENVERHLHMGKSPLPGCHRRRPGTGRPDHRDDHHAGRGVCADRHSGRSDRRAVPGVRLHAGGRCDRLRHRGADPFADDGIEAAARGRHRARFRGWINRRFERVRRGYARL